MKHIDRPHHHVPGTNWHMLGRLKLSPGSNPDETIKGWLMNVVGGLSLPDDLVSRLLASIEDAATRVLAPGSVERQLDFMEIVMLVPSMQTPKGQSWGFFRVERTSTDALNEGTKGHCVEYYLYSDKKTGE